LAGEFQVRLDSRIPAAANGLTNGGGVHSPDEAPKLSYTEFPRRTVENASIWHAADSAP
jgi:hypothetical protein